MKKLKLNDLIVRHDSIGILNYLGCVLHGFFYFLIVRHSLVT